MPRDQVLCCTGLARCESSLPPSEHPLLLSGNARRGPTATMSGDPEHKASHNVMRLPEFFRSEEKRALEQKEDASVFGRDETAHANIRTDKATFARGYQGPELDGGNKLLYDQFGNQQGFSTPRSSEANIKNAISLAVALRPANVKVLHMGYIKDNNHTCFMTCVDTVVACPMNLVMLKIACLLF